MMSRTIFEGIKNLNGFDNFTNKLDNLKTFVFGRVMDKKYLINLSKNDL